MGSAVGPIGPYWTAYAIPAMGDTYLVDYCEDEEQNCIDKITSTNRPLLDIIKIHPNPSTDFVNINIPENHRANQVRVFDQLGRLTIEQELEPFNTTHQMECSFLAEGMYMLKVSTEGGAILIGKFLKVY